MKAHLLYPDRDFDFGAELPANQEDLIQDLELTTTLSAMAGGDRFLFDISKRVVLARLEDPASIRYRQQILADCLAAPEIIREMYAIAVAALEDRRHLWSLSSLSPSGILSAAIGQLEAAVVRLKALRQIADREGASVGSAGLTNLFRTLQEELDDDYFETVTSQLRQLHFRNGVLISAQLDRDNSGIGFVLRPSGTAKVGWRERIGIGPRSSYSFTLPPRDEAGFTSLSELTSRGVNLVANAAAQSADHIASYFSMLRAELGFYVGCLNLRDRLVAKGAPMSFPDPLPVEAATLMTVGLIDVSLALSADDPVVGNDVDATGRSLVVITGANSGGKSTFLRSVGLAQLMMQCGLFVTASTHAASLCHGVFTHFIREEDPSMTSGRLDEELSRMSATADQLRRGCLMLFNESFSSTNEREGSEICRQIVRALLDADVRVFFVTHQFDFAESFWVAHDPATLFLRAERQVDGQPSYKLAVAEPLPTSFGEDIYHRLGGWFAVEDSAGRPTVGIAQDAG